MSGQQDLVLEDAKNSMIKLRAPLWLHKLRNYEYWPIWFFYIPIALYLTYLAFRARSLTFFTVVNPFIKDSGIIRYSKFDVLECVPDTFKPKGILIKKGQPVPALPVFLTFPIIAKPDMGERGKGVMMVQNLLELQSYSERIDQDFIIQEYCDLPQEGAIFYMRKPSESRGSITSFTTKEFLSVQGDGLRTIHELMKQSYRASMQIKRQCPHFLKAIPENNEVIKIEAIGNHNRGTRFINSNHLITDKLITVFDDISKHINGFYYGRYDFKFNSIKELEVGLHVKIVELNGINSEPVHIYDQSTGLVNSYRDFFSHIKFMFEISEENKVNGYKRTKAIPFWVNIFFGK